MTRLRFRLFAVLIGALFALGMAAGPAAAAMACPSAGTAVSVVADHGGGGGHWGGGHRGGGWGGGHHGGGWHHGGWHGHGHGHGHHHGHHGHHGGCWGWGCR